MATINWQSPSADTLVNIAQNAARIQQAIAIISRQTDTSKTSKVDNFLFIAASDGSSIRLRNDSKQLLELNLSFIEGLSYETPSTKDGSPNIALIDLIAGISKHSYKLNTELGLDWLIVALSVYNAVYMRRIDAVSTDIQYATVDDWIDALDKINEVSAIRIIDWLINASSIKHSLSSADKVKLMQLSNQLTLTNSPEILTPLLPVNELVTEEELITA
jgi:hypothetical protein